MSNDWVAIIIGIGGNAAVLAWTLWLAVLDARRMNREKETQP
jgi:hypothetical protein